jgi:hypothetical protein
VPPLNDFINISKQIQKQMRWVLFQLSSISALARLRCSCIKYCEYFMQEVEQINPEEKPLEDQASYSEESSTQVSTEICIPLIEDDVYSISIFIFF